MATRPARHPSPAELANFGLGNLPEERRALIEAHIENCQTCSSVVGATHDDTFVQLTRAAQPTADTLDPASVPAELHDHPRYRILRRLGAGGMGVVYQAEHKLMGRLVALKVIRRELTVGTGMLDRFRREVRLAAQLQHPHIVAAHDAEEAGDLLFLVMEYVEGQSLDRLVAQQGRLPIEQARELVRQAALGLQHAHSAGLVHRDIKPHNLMLTPQGQVKVLDFGLARPEEPTATAITGADLIVGTPDFMAPEQAKDSRKVDVRTDVYALGCTLFYLLTGHAPFTRTTPLETVMAHIADDIPAASAERPELPASLCQLLERMLAKAPAERPANMGAVVAALSTTEATAVMKALPTAPSPSTPRPTLSRRQLLLAGAAGLGAMLLGGGLYALTARPGSVRESSRGPNPPASTTHTSSTSSTAQANSTNAGDRLKVLILIPRAGVWGGDYEPLRRELVAAGVQVKTVSSSAGPCLDAEGKLPPVHASTVNPQDLSAVHALIVCGGKVDEFLVGGQHAAVAGLLTQARQQRQWLVSICTGAQVLLEHGLLANHFAARSPYREKFYGDRPTQQRPERWVNDRVVTSQRLLTAAGPEDAAELARTLVRTLQAAKP